jgi:group I intron endonuclease
MIGTIYITTNLINKKQYIGQTIRPLQERIKGHLHKNGCIAISSAIKKYGVENFKWISFSCPEEDLDWQEQFLIKELNTLSPNGYNLETGGHKNKKLSEKTKEKIGQALSGKKGRKHSEETKKKIGNRYYPKGRNHPNFGKKWTKEQKDNLSKKRKNIPHTQEHKDKISAALKGIIRSSETKQKMRLSQIGNKNAKKHK